MSEPLTPERAARECAEGLVSVKDGGAESYHLPYALLIGTFAIDYSREKEPVDAAAARLCPEIAAAVLAAIERYARSFGGLPSPLSGERLAEIQETHAEYDKNGWTQAHEHRGDLLAEVLHLRAAVREIVRSGCEPEAYALGMKRGEALGARKQREADVEIVRELSRWGVRPPLKHAAGLLAGTPLVTDTKEDKP